MDSETLTKTCFFAGFCKEKPISPVNLRGIRKFLVTALPAARTTPTETLTKARFFTRFREEVFTFTVNLRGARKVRATFAVNLQVFCSPLLWRRQGKGVHRLPPFRRDEMACFTNFQHFT